MAHLSLRFLATDRLALVGLVIVLVASFLALAFAALGSAVTPYNPSAPNLGQSNLPPSLAHPFGTDFEGRDILSRVMAALPIDLGIPVAVVVISSVIGVLLGTVAGYKGGWVDEVVMRVTDLFLAFPTIVMVLAVAATLGPSVTNAALSLIFVWWPPYVRLVRGGVLEVGSEDFIAISKSLNSSFFYIMTKGILSNVLPAILTYATLDVGTALIDISILGFFGVGIPPGTPELGVMVSSISFNLYTYPWEGLIPAFVTMLIAAGFSFLGDGAREASDVKVRPHILFRPTVERQDQAAAA